MGASKPGGVPIFSGKVLVVFRNSVLESSKLVSTKPAVLSRLKEVWKFEWGRCRRGWNEIPYVSSNCSCLFLQRTKEEENKEKL